MAVVCHVVLESMVFVGNEQNLVFRSHQPEYTDQDLFLEIKIYEEFYET